MKRAKNLLRRLVLRVRGIHTASDYRRAGAQIGANFLGNGVEINLNDCPFVSIGDDVVFGPRVLILAHDAALRSRVGYTKVLPVRVDDGAFVGAGSILLPGTTVGRAAIIAAGSVVRGPIPADQVWGGAPAKYICDVAPMVERARERMRKEPNVAAGWQREFRRGGSHRERILEQAPQGGWFY